MIKIVWQTRYSDTDEDDQFGRWARIAKCNGRIVSWINRTKFVNIENKDEVLYQAKCFFPLYGEHEYFDHDKNLENLKNKIEKEFNAYIKDINNEQ